MKKLVCVVALLLILSVSTQAQNRGTGLGFFGGLGMPSSPSEFTDLYNGGFTLGSEIQFRVAPRTTIVGRIAYHRFGIDEEKAEELIRGIVFFPGTLTSFSVEGGNIRGLAFTGNVRQQLTAADANASFFLTGGLGLYNISVGDITASGSYTSPFETGSFTTTLDSDDSQTEFGINFGIGIETGRHAATGILIEGRYNMVFTDLVPDSDSANFFTFLGGLHFRL